jgi:Tfp pilus assembly protein PilF
MLVDSARVSPSSGNKDPNARYLRVRLGGNREVGKRAEQLFVIARQRYLRDGDVDNAARLFDESIRLAPTFARPYTYRAAIAADLGDHEAGLAWLQRGLQADRSRGALIAASASSCPSSSAIPKPRCS